jgi:cation diffusion facilitator family transporter
MAYQTLRWPLLLSIVAAVLTIGMKATAYAVTGSVGLFSDALESGVNLLAAVAATFSLWYAHQPSDAEHPYGHEKIEFFSSGLEGALVFVAGLVTAYYAVERLIVPKELEQLGLGTVLALVASAINFGVAVLLLRVGKRHGSIILEADGHHLMTDVLTSVGVVGGLGLVALTGWKVLDPLLALGVGLNILFTGFKLVRRSFDGLMDRAWPADELAAVREVIRAALPPGTDFHHLRTRRAGRRKFLDFHLLVAGGLSVRDGHDIAHRIEERVTAAVPEAEVTIHVEPIDDRASWEESKLAQLGEPTAPRGNRAEQDLTPRPPLQSGEGVFKDGS